MILTTLTSLRGALLAGFVLALSATSSAQTQDDGHWSKRAGGAAVVGSGKVGNEARAVAAFQAVELMGPVDLVLRQAAKEAVEVRADENLLPLIETTVVERGGLPTLQIRVKEAARYTTRSNVVVLVDVVALKSLALRGSGDAVARGLKTGELRTSLSGSGDLKLEQLSTDALAIAISGSGDVAATGRAAKLNISIAGSGDVTAGALESDEVHVSIAGSGDASVHARKALSIAIAGSGNVDYSGDPTMKTSIAGSGSVKRH